ncbi:MAG: flagellar hook-associated protein FlgK [Peptococcaceae bacterium]|jgi:flagellar hook-associated protein 1 FlgK|nr:flagellar hook-associated protein FlgK [Peptococcaceae bacterium]
MISTFFGINLADTAIQTATQDINVTGQNIANAATPGYTEEVPQNTATDPYTVPMLNNPVPGQVGTGVEVKQITRSVDPWVNQQVNNSDSILSYWKNLTDQLQVAQTAFQEPTPNGLQSAMDNFFNSWQTLSEDPTNMGARATVVNDAQELINDFHTGSGLLSQTAANIQGQMQNEVVSINSMAAQIAALNQKIASVTAQGEQPNTLEDNRDLLVSQLAQLAPVSVTPVAGAGGLDTGAVNVSIYGEQVVTGSTVALSVTLPGPNAGNQNILDFYSGNTLSATVSLTSPPTSYADSGGLTGLETARRNTDNYLGQLDTLAYNLVQEVNMQHQQGANGQALVTDGSTTITAGSFDLQVGGGTTVTVSFTNTVGTNLGLLQGMAAAVNSASDGVTATVVTDPQAGTSYLNVVSSTSVPTSITLSDVSGGDAVAYTGGSQGYTSTYDYNGNAGGLFFASLGPTVAGSATNIGLSTNISPNADGANPNLDAIAAAATSTDPRDGTNALALANLQNAAWSGLNNTTFDGYYQTTTETVGAGVQNATQMQTTAQATNTQLVNMQQSVSGVSTDQEMAQLVQYQYAYQAAAQFLLVQNNILNTLVNQTLS